MIKSSNWSTETISILISSRTSRLGLVSFLTWPANKNLLIGGAKGGVGETEGLDLLCLVAGFFQQLALSGLERLFALINAAAWEFILPAADRVAVFLEEQDVFFVNERDDGDPLADGYVGKRGDLPIFSTFSWMTVKRSALMTSFLTTLYM